MIFSKFFKAKWQSKNANDRLTAIANDLAISNNEQLNILINLALSDSNDNVRKAALLKINDIELYVRIFNEALQNKNNAVISAFAQKQIEKQLLENNTAISTPVKSSLVQQLPKSKLEQWLLIENDIEITKSIYQRIAKPQMAISLFTKKQDEQFQLFLLSDITEPDLLEKLLKKTTLSNVVGFIEKRLEDIKLAKEIPLQLTKDVQLTLAKLLALKDNNSKDYEEVLAQRNTLENEWQQEQINFSSLTTEQQHTFTEKYEYISNQLTKFFAQKAEIFEQEKIARQIKQEQEQVKQQINSVFKKLEQTLANAVFENIDLTGSEFEQQLNSLPTQISSSALTEQDKIQLQEKTELLQKKLKQLPIIAQSVTDATHLISRISQLTLPENMTEFVEKNEIYQQWLEQWKKVSKQSIGALPDSIKSAKKEIEKQWEAGLKHFINEQKEYVNQARKNIADLKRLIDAGKFNPCFGIYKKLKVTFELLAANQKQRLQRDFDLLSEKMAELADWEHYIATPKKQELLDQIKALVEMPLDNPNDQANKVKTYRQQWNSLGHADDDIEKALNEEFNQACEVAFAPCRQFYAEQDKIRQLHAEQRLLIIEKMNVLANDLAIASSNNSSVDFKVIIKQLSQLNKAWREAGEVDKAQYQNLQKQFNKAQLPIKTAINNFQTNNAELKDVIIKKSQACLAQENIFDAINDIKNLQAQWRDIGYAGPENDNKQWQTFSAIKDEIFAKRDQIKQAQTDELAEIKVKFDNKLAQLKTQFSIAKNIAQYQAVEQEAHSLLSEITDNQPVIRACASKAEKLIADINKALEIGRSDKTKQDWFNVFQVIENMATSAEADVVSSESFNALPSFWQKKLSDIVDTNEINDRSSKTLELEILAGIESPSEFSQQRLETQVSLLQHQMLSGGNVDLLDLFIDWLKIGKFTAKDKSLIERIKPIYC